MQSYLNKLDQSRVGAIFKERPALGPRSVNIHITNACNFKCLFCWDRSPHIAYNEEKVFHMNPTVLNNVISDCFQMGVQTICLEGGEITLYPSIEKLVKSIKQKGLNLEIYSNCCVNKTTYKVLSYADKIKLNFSATNPSLYKLIHGTKERGAFKRVLNTLVAMSKLRKYCGKPTIQLIFVISELNYFCLNEVFDICERFQIDELTLKLIEATVRTKELIPGTRSINYLKQFFKKIKSNNLKVKHNAEDIQRIISNKYFKKECYGINETEWHNDRFFYFTAPTDYHLNCFVGWFYAFIDLKGRALGPCDNVGVAFLGDVNQQPFKKIWFSDKYQKLRREARESIDLKKEKWQECRNCGFVGFNQRISKSIKES